jgi:hypothetical protein
LSILPGVLFGLSVQLFATRGLAAGQHVALGLGDELGGARGGCRGDGRLARIGLFASKLLFPIFLALLPAGLRRRAELQKLQDIRQQQLAAAG